MNVDPSWLNPSPPRPPARGRVIRSTGRCCTWAGRRAPSDAWQSAGAPASPYGSPLDAAPIDSYLTYL